MFLQSKKFDIKSIFISGLEYATRVNIILEKNSCYNSKFLPEIETETYKETI